VPRVARTKFRVLIFRIRKPLSVSELRRFEPGRFGRRCAVGTNPALTRARYCS
jgi:hypothetical protein